MRDEALPPRLPSEARANVSKAGLRTLQVLAYLPLTSQRQGSSVVLLVEGVRTCLPLRGSSGLSPDSLFTPRTEVTVE